MRYVGAKTQSNITNEVLHTHNQLKRPQNYTSLAQKFSPSRFLVSILVYNINLYIKHLTLIGST